MNYEQKYKNALERACTFYKRWDGINAADSALVIKEVKEIFPELTKSEDEKIKEDLIQWINEFPDIIWRAHYKKDVIAWLEKQGEQETICDKCRKEQPSHSCQDITALGRCAVEYEQKTINDIDEDIVKEVKDTSILDMAEPKFKVGDWVVFNNKHQSVYQVEKIEDGYYILRHTHGGTFRICVLHDESLRPWSIDDVKDGDILVTKEDERPFIFKGLLDPNHPDCPVAYCGIDSENLFLVSYGVGWWTDEEVEPATKEQRDTLFARMREAGYEWDAEKRELNKIEQKYTSWSEEDERIHQCLIRDQEKALDDVRNDKYGHSEIISDLEEMYCERIHWLKSLKERIGE